METSQCRFASKQYNGAGRQRACQLLRWPRQQANPSVSQPPRGNHRARWVKKTEAGRELGLANPHSVGVPEASPAYLAAIVVVVGAKEAVMNWGAHPDLCRGCRWRARTLARKEYLTEENWITKAKLKGGLNSRTASELRTKVTTFGTPLPDRCDGRTKKVRPEKQCDGTPNRHLACNRIRSAESSQASTANCLASLRLWSGSTQRA